jgi:RimJ/RimL family protein N-acetyltransferase
MGGGGRRCICRVYRAKRPALYRSFYALPEVGWRFRKEYWGRSLAYRAACEALSFGFGILKLPEIVSFTAATNVRSQALMKRLVFQYDARDDFDHPALPDGHILRRHVLYRRKREAQPLPPDT